MVGLTSLADHSVRPPLRIFGEDAPTSITSYENLEDTANQVKEENEDENNPEQDTNVPSSVGSSL